MLLVEFTINAVVNYVSDEGHPLTHNYRPRVTGFDSPTLSIPTDHGGYCQMTYGSISFRPDLFESDWPPPVNGAIGIYYTDTTEEDKETVFAGVAHLQTFNRESVTYDLYRPDYDEQIAASTAYNATLNNVMNTILTTIPEITSVDTTYARASSPNVTHTTSSAQVAIELASNIAAFYSHLFYVGGSTAYLVDMKLDNGTSTLTEFEFFSMPEYQYKTPVSRAVCGTAARFSDYPYGEELSVDQYHTTAANINTALDDIIAIENAPRITFSVPMVAGCFPLPGQKITLPDTSNVADLSSYVRVRKMTFDFLEDRVTIEGEGAISAA
jgi:hypothetical protein